MDAQPFLDIPSFRIRVLLCILRVLWKLQACRIQPRAREQAHSRTEEHSREDFVINHWCCWRHSLLRRLRKCLKSAAVLTGSREVALERFLQSLPGPAEGHQVLEEGILLKLLLDDLVLLVPAQWLQIHDDEAPGVEAFPDPLGPGCHQERNLDSW